jgi:hypothetical protein
MSVTVLSAPTRPHHGLLLWVLTACGAIAAPALFGVDQTRRDMTLASVALGLTALVIGFALRRRKHGFGIAVPAGRRTHTLSWSPP